MKTPSLLAMLLLGTIAAFAQLPPQPAPALPVRPVQPAPPAPRDTANYLITVKWVDSKAGTNSLKVLTSEGSFSLDTIHSSVRINENDIPTTVSFNGSINPLGPEKAGLKVFLGRTVPYVTGTYSGGTGGGSSSYQQMRVGFDSAFTVTFGKPLVIQADQNGEVSILVKREEN